MYHFSSSKTSTSLDEPVFLSKFLTTFILPPALRPKYGTTMMTEQLIKMGGLAADKLPETVEQHFRSTSRRFLGGTVDTKLDVDLTFEANVSKSGIIYPYNVLREWSYLGYDPQTGFFGLKRDMVGSCIIDVHVKDGVVLRKFYFPIFFPIKPLNEFALDYVTEAIYQPTMTFAAENYTDKIIQGNVG